MTARYDFTMRQGATFNPVLLYSAPTFTVVPITGITQSGRAAVTAPAHGLTRDWPVFIVGAGGMTEINHTSAELLCPADAYYARYVSAGALSLDLDSSGFSAYTSGGELLYHPPMDVSAYTARMQIRATQTSTTVLAELTTENGGIVLGADGTITLYLSAEATALLTFTKAVYDLELIAPGSPAIVSRVFEGSVIMGRKEVTR